MLADGSAAIGSSRTGGARIVARLTDDMPTMICPKCGAEHPDHDGFGFIAHTKPAYSDGCGWCSHPTRDKAAGSDEWICGICGDARIEDAGDG